MRRVGGYAACKSKVLAFASSKPPTFLFMQTNSRQILFSLLVLAVCSCIDDESAFVKQSTNMQSLVISILSEEGETAMPGAHVQIYDGEMLLAEFISSGGDDNFSFDGEAGKQYILKVLKEDFETHRTRFTADGLDKGAQAVLKVRMKPVLELAVSTWEENDFYSIALDGTGVITIVWPDSNTEILAMPLSTGMELSGADGQEILIKGDISGITSFNAFGYNTSITEISGLKHLRNMTSFSPGRLILSAPLDLRHSRNLETIDVYEAILPDWLRFPKHHALSHITVTLSDRLITTAEIDDLINNVYDNSTRRDIRNGTMHLTNSDTPSQQAEQMINMLEMEYGWSIELNY